MPSAVRVRMLQALLGTACSLLAVVPLIRSPGRATLPVAAAAALVSYFAARTVPDITIPADEVLGVCAIGLAVICIGIVVVAVGGPQAQQATAIVMAYCAGNRLRAAGIGPAH